MKYLQKYNQQGLKREVSFIWEEKLTEDENNHRKIAYHTPQK